MKLKESLDKLDATLHIGKEDSHIVITLLVSNNSNTKFKDSCGNGMWSQISLQDEDNLSRLEGIATVAAVTHWEIDVGEHLCYQVVTETPEEASETWSGWEDYNYISNPEKYKENQDQDKTYFANSLDIEKEKDVQFTAEADIFFDGGHRMSLTFKPHEIEESPIETDSLEMGQIVK